MSRQIDPENLSDQDRRYLFERPWKLKELEYQGYSIDLGLEEVEKVTDHTVITTEDNRVGNVPHEFDDPRAGVVIDDGEDNYEEWTVADLVAEIEERNGVEGAPQISKSGKKDELIARLREDDGATE